MEIDLADIKIRTADVNDLSALSAFRGNTADDQYFWLQRIGGYLNATYHPQQALPKRVIFASEYKDSLIGWIAGHLTRRYDCQGELQWLDVQPEFRFAGVASALLTQLMLWFQQNGAARICVNCAPDNNAALAFYRKNGAQQLNDHWLVWPDIEK
ncbi:N-acetyltransferase [Mucilaginibacter sp. AK015]|uniref:GNAT family N-acetyltransferase n=1 Tax=Mucilaginibacter sp. AK015 TaxID=2723072 RepID=UPI00161314B4|nr:GNAT family N-acetyltransferase [Mucilaginibacter sp. AK015]MBB5394259.1 ribosomal protein S18 acetylase RimI-like enzyme [Mucilaginibacter sp. AK015]